MSFWVRQSTASDDDVQTITTVFPLNNKTIRPAPVIQNCIGVGGPDLRVPDVVDTGAGQRPDGDQGGPLGHGEHVSAVQGPRDPHEAAHSDLYLGPPLRVLEAVQQHQAGLVAGGQQELIVRTHANFVNLNNDSINIF